MGPPDHICTANGTLDALPSPTALVRENRLPQHQPDIPADTLATTLPVRAGQCDRSDRNGLCRRIPSGSARIHPVTPRDITACVPPFSRTANTSRHRPPVRRASLRHRTSVPRQAQGGNRREPAELAMRSSLHPWGEVDAAGPSLNRHFPDRTLHRDGIRAGNPARAPSRRPMPPMGWPAGRLPSAPASRKRTGNPPDVAAKCPQKHLHAPPLGPLAGPGLSEDAAAVPKISASKPAQSCQPEGGINTKQTCINAEISALSRTTIIV